MPLLAALGLRPPKHWHNGARPAPRAKSAGPTISGRGLDSSFGAPPDELNFIETKDLAENKPPQAKGKGGDPRAVFEKRLAGVESELQAVLHEVAASKDAGAVQSEIVEAWNRLDAAAHFQGDFVAANAELDDIIEKLERYRKIAAEVSAQLKSKLTVAQESAKRDFEADLKGIQARLARFASAKVNPNEPLAEKRTQIIGLISEMNSAATGGLAAMPDYAKATVVLKQIKKLVAEYTAVGTPIWKKKYEVELEALSVETLKRALDSKQWTAEAVVSAGKLVVAQKSAMESSVAKGDYEEALPQFSRLRALLGSFETEFNFVAETKTRFEALWKAEKAEYLGVLKEKPPEPELISLHAQLDAINVRVLENLRKYQYLAAQFDLSDGLPLVKAYRAAEKKTPRYLYPGELAKLQPSLDQATSMFSWLTAPDLVKQQQEIETKKTAMGKAAAAGDFASALGQLRALAKLVADYLAESGKTPQEVKWVTGLAIALHANIDVKYHMAASKLNDAAKAYKQALELQKQALEEPPSFAQQFLVGLFFAGLGGAAGGLVGKLFDTAKTLGKAAITDASKDIAKFLARSWAPLVDGKSKKENPLDGLNPLVGDGVDLALSIGARLHDEAAKLKLAVGDLGKVLMDSPPGANMIRIDGNPMKALDSDPFLKVLGSIEVDVRRYSTLVWAEWGDRANDRQVWHFYDDIKEQTGGIKSLEARAAKHQREINENADKRATRG